jgi:hypothetical protein
MSSRRAPISSTRASRDAEMSARCAPCTANCARSVMSRSNQARVVLVTTASASRVNAASPRTRPTRNGMIFTRSFPS